MTSFRHHRLFLFFCGLFCSVLTTAAMVIIISSWLVEEKLHLPYLENTNEELGFKRLQREDLPQLPLNELFINQRHLATDIRTCNPTHPNIWEIDFNNFYWQIFKTRNGVNVYLYAAYYDDRPLMRNGKNQRSVVRVTAMLDHTNPPKSYCQFWSSHSRAPILSTAFYKPLWRKDWGNYMDGVLLPHLITCRIPFVLNVVPTSVTITEKPCDRGRNNLKIFNDRLKNKIPNPSFVVCVKNLAFWNVDLSIKLTEWLELLKLLGVHKVLIYELSFHSNVSKLLRFYQKQDFVNVIKISLPGNQPNIPELMMMYQSANIVTKRQNELISYNDCFYRQMYKYDYISLLDIDEIIIPTANRLTTWADILNSLIPSGVEDAICARNVYFFDDWKVTDQPKLPRYLYMLNHVKRSANYTKLTEYVKCFHDTRRVIALHNHFPIACAHRNYDCTVQILDSSIAQLQHYRKDCTLHLANECKMFRSNAVVDKSIRRYLKRLAPKVRKTLHALNFL